MKEMQITGSAAAAETIVFCDLDVTHTASREWL